MSDTPLIQTCEMNDGLFANSPHPCSRVFDQMINVVLTRPALKRNNTFSGIKTRESLNPPPPLPRSAEDVISALNNIVNTHTAGINPPLLSPPAIVCSRFYEYLSPRRPARLVYQGWPL